MVYLQLYHLTHPKRNISHQNKYQIKWNLRNCEAKKRSIGTCSWRGIKVTAGVFGNLNETTTQRRGDPWSGFKDT